MVARQRGDDQHRGLALHLREQRQVVSESLESQQATERLVDRDLLLHCHIDAVDVHGRDVELGLLVLLGQPMQQIQPGRHPVRHGRVGEGRERMVV
jgi:hypothetical protein